MKGWQRTCVWGTALAFATALAGCAVVDNFSGRAVDYNLEAERAQEQTMLLNIVRASLRRPMQFTGLQSITGNASMNVGSTLTAPFGEAMHRPRGSVSPDVFGLSGAVSGGPSFIVPVLDTQEFYEGILNPISLQIFDYYLEQGFPPQVLFDLFVAKVEVTWGPATPSGAGAKPAANVDCRSATRAVPRVGSDPAASAANGDAAPPGDCLEVTYTNSVASDAEFDRFQAIADLLFAEGLWTEHVPSTTPVGAPIQSNVLQPTDGERNADQAAQLIQAYAAAAQAGLKIVKVKKEADEAPGREKAGDKANGNSYQVEKNTTSYRFCFHRFGDAVVPNDSPLLCGSKANGEANASQEDASTTGSTVFDLHVNPKLQALLQARLGSANTEGRSVKSAAIYLRSTEGIIYYLGEVVRRALYPDQGKEAVAPRVIKVPTQVPEHTMPTRSCDNGTASGRTNRYEKDLMRLDPPPVVTENPPPPVYFCDDIFVVAKNAGGGFVSVTYDGDSYNLPEGSDRSGRTYQVLEIAKQVLAVNTSAKQLPATSVVVISQP